MDCYESFEWSNDNAGGAGSFRRPALHRRAGDCQAVLVVATSRLYESGVSIGRSRVGWTGDGNNGSGQCSSLIAGRTEEHGAGPDLPGRSAAGGSNLWSGAGGNESRRAVVGILGRLGRGY